MAERSFPLHYIILPLLGLLAAGLHIYFSRQARDAKSLLETVMAYGLVFNMGVSGLYAFLGHAFIPDQVAEYIGWPPGSPFQFEVAVANLAFGTLGILCFWLRGRFWLATIIGVSVFTVGAAYGHVADMMHNHNYAPGNAGAPLYADVVRPIVFALLYALHAKLSRK